MIRLFRPNKAQMERVGKRKSVLVCTDGDRVGIEVIDSEGRVKQMTLEADESKAIARCLTAICVGGGDNVTMSWEIESDVSSGAEKSDGTKA